MNGQVVLIRVYINTLGKSRRLLLSLEVYIYTWHFQLLVVGTRDLRTLPPKYQYQSNHEKHHTICLEEKKVTIITT